MWVKTVMQCSDLKESTNFLAINLGVSITIEVASRFEKSNRLYQKEAFTSLLFDGSGDVHPLKISKFQCPKMRFPAFWALNMSTKDNVFRINAH